jgi:hypothetical protein
MVAKAEMVEQTRKNRLTDKKDYHRHHNIQSRQWQYTPAGKSGNRDSGTWSRPVALLPAGRFVRRFRKLENKSPAIAMLSTRVPIFQLGPTRAAYADVTRIEAKARGTSSMSRIGAAHQQT